MRNVIVTGGSHAELPIIKSLQKMGYYVITTGNNKGGLGHLAADLYVEGDFSDCNFVKDIAIKYEVEGIVSGCNDFAYLSTAYACECLGLPGHDSYETAKRIHHKDAFRQLLRNCKLPCPYCKKILTSEDLKSLVKEINFPLLIKPIDLTGGKGVQICNNYDELERAYINARKCTREEYVIAEQMILGENHGVSVLLNNNKVVFAFFDNEEYYINPYLVSGANTPCLLSKKTKQNIIRQIEVIAETADLVDGLFHCQCITTKDDIAYLIDPCRRAPGDLYIKLVEYATGISYSEAIIEAEMGNDFKNTLIGQYEQVKCVARECVMTNKDGVFSNISISNDLQPYLMDKLIWAKQGDIIENYMKYKAGIVFFKFPDYMTMNNMLDGLYDKMIINMV